jgi:hypothetical protein
MMVTRNWERRLPSRLLPLNPTCRLGSRRSQSSNPLAQIVIMMTTPGPDVSVFGDDPEESVRFVGNAGGEIDAVTQGKQRP